MSSAQGRPKAGETPIGGSSAVLGDRGVVIGPAQGRPKAGETPIGGSSAVLGDRGVVMSPAQGRAPYLAIGGLS